MLHTINGNTNYYGNIRTLTFAPTKRRIVSVKNAAKHNPHEVVIDNIRQTVVEPKTTVSLRSTQLSIVGVQENFYIVSMPDRTFGKVDIKTEQFLGKF